MVTSGRAEASLQRVQGARPNVAEDYAQCRYTQGKPAQVFGRAGERPIGV